MSTSNTTTTDTPQAVLNEFQTYMTLRDAGVDPDNAQRGADHVRRATNEGGDKGATSAAVQVLRWLGLFAVIALIVLGIAQYANAAAPANMIHLPVVGNDCRYRCSSSVPYPTLIPTPVINEPPMLPTPTVVIVEVQ